MASKIRLFISFGMTKPVPVPVQLLGRWFIESDVAKILKKFDQANEDHCGCCIATAPQKSEEDSYYEPFIV